MPTEPYEGTAEGINGDRKSRKLFFEIREDFYLFFSTVQNQLCLSFFFRLFRFHQKMPIKIQIHLLPLKFLQDKAHRKKQGEDVVTYVEPLLRRNAVLRKFQ